MTKPAPNTAPKPRPNPKKKRRQITRVTDNIGSDQQLQDTHGFLFSWFGKEITERFTRPASPPSTPPEPETPVTDSNDRSTIERAMSKEGPTCSN